MEELKPCPYCGKKNPFLGAENEIRIAYEGDGNEVFAVCCDYTDGGCGACGGYRETKEEAVEAWNRRAAQLVPEHAWFYFPSRGGGKTARIEAEIDRIRKEQPDTKIVVLRKKDVLK